MDFITSLPSLLLRNFLNNLDLVAMLVAFNVMTFLAHRKARGEGMKIHGLETLPLWMGVGGVVGARLAYVVPNFDQYLRHPADLLLINGGMYFYGAALGVMVAGWWASRRVGLGFWRTADYYALYASLAMAVFRGSCLLTNQCYGGLADPPLGIRFPGLAAPRYPSELYEGLLALGLLGALIAVYSRRWRAGTTFLAFLVGYPLLRALVDLTRIDFGSRWGALDIQLSLAVALVASALLAYRIWISKRRGTYRHHPDEAIRFPEAG